MITEVTTKYKAEFLNWLNSETEMQKLGLSQTFNWQWFITMTSKDVMTKNGARLAITRFLGMYLQETKTESVTCFWVTEPHNQGKKGYHIHALLETKWPVPKELRRELHLALMLDDVYQRAMGVIPQELYNGETVYKDKWGRITQKHRFRAESYSKARGEYCAKYITKGASDWEFAHVTQTQVQEQGKFFEESRPEDSLKDCKGNWNKKAARLRTRHAKMRLELCKGEKVISLRQLTQEADVNYAKFAKLRVKENELEITMSFQNDPGVKIYV